MTVGERSITKGRVEAMLKLATSRLMLEVSGETVGDDGGCKHGA